MGSKPQNQFKSQIYRERELLRMIEYYLVCMGRGDLVVHIVQGLQAFYDGDQFSIVLFWVCCLKQRLVCLGIQYQFGSGSRNFRSKTLVNYFIIFLQIVNMTNFYGFLLGSTNNIVLFCFNYLLIIKHYINSLYKIVRGF